MLRKLTFLIFFALACGSQENTQFKSADEINQLPLDHYQETYRPQVHFSPISGWMNDPNGMIYYEGEYHLFYQHYPDSTVWGPMHWGHAISTDLIHWEHLPIALFPDSLGYIFSGSVVLDKANTTGLGTLEKPVLVALFTYHNRAIEEAGGKDYKYQGLAYSSDKGRTWTKYLNNPVLPNLGQPDFRDPKVFWHKESRKWIMILAVRDHVELFGSGNLIDWKFLSRFGDQDGEHRGVWECPDLIPLKVEGTNEYKWILIASINQGPANRGSCTQYFVGDFDGIKFINGASSSEVKWMDAGWDNYAGVTYANTQQLADRTIYQGWMSNWEYAIVTPTIKWRSAMTLPREINLLTDSVRFWIRQNPVIELNNLRKDTLKVNSFKLSGEQDWSKYLSITEPLLDIDIVLRKSGQMSSWYFLLSNEKNEELAFGFDEATEEYFVNREKATLLNFSTSYQSKHTAPRISSNNEMRVRVLLDQSSIEIFYDEGDVVFTEQLFPTQPFTRMSLTSPNTVLEVEGAVYHLTSIWH